ncbi:MAG: glycosyltransferase family 4 protein, partial [Hadesarchaea archaeon]|nr:glycosyltransferase family 4 protein [Hadesarchaea archaeon]
PDASGVPTYIMGLGRALAKLGVEPVVIAHAHPGLAKEEELDGISVKRLEGFVMPVFDRAISPRIASELHKCIKYGGFDVVHGQDIYSSMALQSIFSAYKCGIPSVLTCHSVHNCNGFWELIHKPLLLPIKRADRIIAVSNASAGFCRAFGVPENKIKVILNGLDPQEFDPNDGPRIRANLGIGSRPLVVTAIRLVKRKGPRYLIMAFSKVLQNVPDAMLVIAGDGPEATNLRKLVKKLNIENSVLMLGRLHHKQVLKLMTAADVFVLPSLMESFGLVLLEAMMAGTPIVCTRVGGVPEVVENGVNGLMVPPADDNALADAILMILNNRELAKRLSRNGLKIVRERFNWEKTAKETLALYETIS